MSDNESPFPHTFGLYMFLLSAYTAPAAVQLAVTQVGVKLAIFTGTVLVLIAVMPSSRWVITNSAGIRKSMLFNLAVQAVALLGAWALAKPWPAAAGLRVATLIGGFISMPWQQELRDRYHIPTRIE